jgi:hypothetical protein
MDAPALYGSLEEAASSGAGAGQDMDALLGALRDKHRARRQAPSSPQPLGRGREATALRRNQELGQHRVRLDGSAAGPGASALGKIAANTERVQTHAAQLSLHESTKELLDGERAEWRGQLASVNNALKAKDAAIGALQRRCDLLGVYALQSA